MKKPIVILLNIILILGSCTRKDEFVYVEDGRLYHSYGKELSLWGVNLQPCLSWEYNFYMEKVGIPRDGETWKQMVNKSLAELGKMNCQVLRCHLTPADFTDGQGNLVETFYLDMLDYMIAAAREKGIYLYFAFLNHMGSGEVENSFMNFAPEWNERPKWLLDEGFIEKTQNYVRQLLERTNPFTGIPYKKDTNIVLWELINEPLYYSYEQIQNEEKYYKQFRDWLKRNKLTEDEREAYPIYRKQAVSNYINRMYHTIRKTGAKQPVVWSCNWHRMIQDREDVFEAIAQSKAEVVSFCNYPGQDVCKHPYLDNPEDLTRYDFSEWFKNCYTNREWYGWMLEDNFRKKAKILYEFETFYNQSAYLYPAQAKLFRSLGAQVATMWHYALPGYVQYVNGSHFLNLNCTPRKAASFAVAGALFNHLPLYGDYEINRTTEDVTDNYMFSYEKDLSIYSSKDNYFYSNTVSQAEIPKPHSTVKQILGYGNSPMVTYEGTGVYMIDVSDNQIELSIEPDSKWVKEPWQRDLLSGMVTELDYDSKHYMEINLEGWDGNNCSLSRMEDGEKVPYSFIGGKLMFEAAPGDYVIERK